VEVVNLSGFAKWHSLNSIAVKDVPEEGKFVCVLQKSSTKEILYIGGTTDLRRRLFGNYIGGVGGGTTQRIHALLFEKGAIIDTEVAWKEVTDDASEEKQLREAYFEQYGRLPPWNKQF